MQNGIHWVAHGVVGFWRAFGPWTLPIVLAFQMTSSSSSNPVPGAFWPSVVITWGAAEFLHALTKRTWESPGPQNCPDDLDWFWDIFRA